MCFYFKNYFCSLKNQLGNISINLRKSKQPKYLNYQSKEEIKSMTMKIQITIWYSFILGQNNLIHLL